MKRELEASVGQVEILRSLTDVNRAAEAVQHVCAASWKQPEPYPAFMPQLIEAAAKRGWLRCGVATLDHQPVAAQIWLIAHQRAEIFRLAYVDADRRWSPGSLLSSAMPEQVLDDGDVDVVDYLTGDDMNKRDWLTHRGERWGLAAYDVGAASGLGALARRIVRGTASKAKPPATEARASFDGAIARPMSLGQPGRRHRVSALAMAFMLAMGLGAEPSAAQPALAVGPQLCGPLKDNHYGPLDYLTDRGPKIDIVEQGHFVPNVEHLIRGKTNIGPGHDLNYTLRAVPNHHRALIAVMRYGRKLGTEQPSGLMYPVECYFERALRWRPGDLVARMIYVDYLIGKDRRDDARKQLDFVVANAGDSAFSHYNAGLLFFAIGDHDAALAQAHRAQSLGFLRRELREQLEAKGAWKEAPAGKAAPDAPDVTKATEPAGAPD